MTPATDPTAPQAKTDIILPMSRTPTEDWMALIVSRAKTHEFRKVRYAPTVRRIWFYQAAPISAITYICDIAPPIHRPPQSSPSASQAEEYGFLPEDGGIGHTEFNNYAGDFAGYDYAYPILSCSRLTVPITLAAMREMYGLGAPRGMVYVPEKMKADVDVEKQEKIW